MSFERHTSGESRPGHWENAYFFYSINDRVLPHIVKFNNHSGYYIVSDGVIDLLSALASGIIVERFKTLSDAKTKFIMKYS